MSAASSTIITQTKEGLKKEDPKQENSKIKSAKERPIEPSETGSLTLMSTEVNKEYEDSEYLYQDVIDVIHMHGRVREVLNTVASLLTNPNAERRLTALDFYETPDAEGPRYTKLADEEFCILTTAMRQTKTLTSLDLGWVDENHFSGILEALRFNRSLMKLVLPRTRSSSLDKIQSIVEQGGLFSLDFSCTGEVRSTLPETLNRLKKSRLVSLNLCVGQRIRDAHITAATSQVDKKSASDIAANFTMSAALGETAATIPNTDENALTTLNALTINYYPEHFYLTGLHHADKCILPIETTDIDAISQFKHLSTLRLSAYSDHVFTGFRLALQGLSGLKELQHLELSGFSFSSDQIDQLADTLATWSSCLKSLQITAYQMKTLAASNSVRLVNSLGMLHKLNTLFISSNLLGENNSNSIPSLDADDGVAGYTALAGLLKRKESTLTDLRVMLPRNEKNMTILEPAIENNRYLVSFNASLNNNNSTTIPGVSSPEASARMHAVLTDNRTNQLNWFKIAIGIAFVRANRRSAIRNSILPLLHSANMPDIPRLAGFAVPPSPSAPLLLSGGPQAKKGNGPGLNATAAETVTTSTISAASAIAATSTMQNNKPQ